MITPTISESAREAASQERVHEDWICGMREDYPVEKANLPVGYHVQLAIDKATAPLAQENERLKQACRNIFCPWCQTVYDKGDDPYKAVNEHLNKCLQHPISQRDSLKKQITGLREALQANGIFHTPIALRKNGASWDEYQLDAISRTKHALYTPDFSKQFVKREVLENFSIAVQRYLNYWPEAKTQLSEALAIAKAELEGGK